MLLSCVYITRLVFIYNALSQKLLFRISDVTKVLNNKMFKVLSFLTRFVWTLQATDMAEASYECVLEKLRSTDRA